MDGWWLYIQISNFVHADDCFSSPSGARALSCDLSYVPTVIVDYQFATKPLRWQIHDARFLAVRLVELCICMYVGPEAEVRSLAPQQLLQACPSSTLPLPLPTSFSPFPS